MNRTFGITGLLAAGMSALWVWFIIGAPWFPVYSSASPSLSKWFIWAVASVIGLAAIIAFIRLSLAAHWIALRRNTPLPSAAWRGVFGIYLLAMLALALPVLAGDPSGTHRVEIYLYGCLAAVACVLSIVSISRGFSRTIRNRVSTASDELFL